MIKGLDQSPYEGEQTDIEDVKRQEEELALFSRVNSSESVLFDEMIIFVFLSKEDNEKQQAHISPMPRDGLKMTNGDSTSSDGSEKGSQPRGRVSIPVGTSRLKEPTCEG